VSFAQRGLGVLVALGGALGLAWLSGVPTSYAGSDDALLRLSWRVPGTMVEECRTRTDEELARLAPHMRTPQVCTGRGADYELRLSLDGGEVVLDTIRPAGARHDRPVYVFREVAVNPGVHEVAVAFRALVSTTFDPGDRPIEYAWGGHLRLGPAEIGLVTLADSGDSLVLRDR